jgi:hypothetical protein
VRLRCTTTCRTTATVSVPSAVARRLGLRSTTLRSLVLRVPAGRVRTATLRLPSATARRLRGTRVTLRLVARDAAGTTRTTTRKVLVR